MKNLKIGLLISTYNWHEALELILLSVLKQSIMPSEILIADDGSNNRTKDLIDSYRDRFKIPIIHTWIEDNGFTKSIVLNKAVAKSNSEYIIQIDGDCFLHPKFIEDHIKNVETGLYLYGTRVRIKQKIVTETTKLKNINFGFFSRGINKRPRSIRLSFLSRFFKSDPKISHKLRGCNLSFWRKDFIQINGYNEDFKGWGREDSELVIRFSNINLLGKRLKFCAIVYHLDHDEESKSNFTTNDTFQEITIENKLKFCKNGVDKYLQ